MFRPKILLLFWEFMSNYKMNFGYIIVQDFIELWK